MPCAWGRWGALGALLLALACSAPSRAPAVPPARSRRDAASAARAAAPRGRGRTPRARRQRDGAAGAAPGRPPPTAGAPDHDTARGTARAARWPACTSASRRATSPKRTSPSSWCRWPRSSRRSRRWAPASSTSAQGGFVPGLFNAVARGIALRIAATAAVHAPGRSQLLVARRDLLDSGELADYATLRGKTISRPATLGIATIAIDQALRLGGVPDADVSYVNLGLPGHPGGPEQPGRRPRLSVRAVRDERDRAGLRGQVAGDERSRAQPRRVAVGLLLSA